MGGPFSEIYGGGLSLLLKPAGEDYQWKFVGMRAAPGQTAKKAPGGAAGGRKFFREDQR
jgi:hypothetical protein